MGEHQVLNAWRNIFAVDGVNDDSLTKAETLLQSLTGESPLHVRLASELEELKKLRAAGKNAVR